MARAGSDSGAPGTQAKRNGAVARYGGLGFSEAPGSRERYPGSAAPARRPAPQPAQRQAPVVRYGRAEPAYALDEPSTLHVSADGTRFVASFEGFRPNLYNDPANHCTIGYGHLVHQGPCNGSEPAKLQAGLTEAQARDLLGAELDLAAAAVRELVTVDLNQAQFDALASFTFNVGRGNLRSSTLLRKLNAGSYDEVPAQLRRWTRAGGRVLPGLVRRRAAEGNLFSTGDYSTSTAQGLARARGLDDQLHYGIAGARITDGFYRDAAEKLAITGQRRGRQRHLGMDVSLSNASGGGVEDARRGMPVYAALRGTIPLAELNAVRAADAQRNPLSGLGIPGSGDATLREAVVLTQPWEPTDGDSYGGIVGLACRYTYTRDDGSDDVFTLYLEMLHLITQRYPPKNGAGVVQSIDDYTAAGKQFGFGPRITNNATLSAADLLADPPILIGYAGATEFPHCHMQAAYASGERRYLRAPRFDPAVMLVG